jgi:hypothetical protein
VARWSLGATSAYARSYGSSQAPMSSAGLAEARSPERILDVPVASSSREAGVGPSTLWRFRVEAAVGACTVEKE